MRIWEDLTEYPDEYRLVSSTVDEPKVTSTDPDFQPDVAQYTYRDCPVPDFVLASPNPEVREAFKAGVDGASD